MPYILEICQAGKTREVSKRYSSRYGKKDISRGKNKAPTPEAQEKVNERMSITNLRRLLNENFGYKDIHLVLTYRKGDRPDPEQAKKNLEKFLRDLRRYFKKNDMELKYIAVTEYKDAAIHHHLVISSMDTRDLTDIWKHGKPRPTYLDDTGQYGQLAEYLVKQTRKTFRDPDSPCHKRWSASTNLKKPKVSKRIITAANWKKEPEATKGYYLEKNSLVNGIHEITGMRYQYYSMIKLEPPPPRERIRGSDR
ncbi:MAG TPA: hypothetical protein DIT32_03560 [Peptococcaceae bacterium]|nr:hypothetical protein [Peptococcaceae bacterium]